MLGPSAISLKQIFPYDIDIYDEDYIRLMSSDGYTFVINKRASIQSNFLKLSQKKQYDLPFSKAVLEVVVKYLYYKLRWSVGVIQNGAIEVAQFPPIPENIAMDVAKASIFLEL
ncbi:Conserved_hypothetical protein [Hexamita inflata]|uniref:Elongin-C n=1 Tax=Hexamita inflata TaxID=28002 RepID=A0AA86VH92_9EUKA|nr:Conserved hypothetical protein [Hexamita inflata]